MDEQTAPDTRSRILATARKLFLEQGYEPTSLRQIATRLGVSKAAVLYHFPTKAQILATLVRPLMDANEAILDAAEALDPAAARWATVEGLLDGCLANLDLLRISDGWWAIRDPLLARVREVNTRAIRLIAGPDAGPRERIRASAVMALLARPAMFHRDIPLADVRREVLAAAHELFTDPADPGTAAPSRPRRAGRRSVMTDDKLATARRLHQAGTHTADEIAERLGVSRATLYRHLKEPTPGQPSNSET